MFTFDLLDETYAVCRLEPDAAVPDWATGEFNSITRTTEELSIICPAHVVPDTVRHDSNWRCLKIMGPLELSLIGILAEITRTLALADVNVLAIGTFDTDYLLVKHDRLAIAVAALRRAGHRFITE